MNKTEALEKNNNELKLQILQTQKALLLERQQLVDIQLEKLEGMIIEQRNKITQSEKSSASEI